MKPDNSDDPDVTEKHPTLALLMTVLIAITPASSQAQTSAAPACSTALNMALPEKWADWTAPETMPAAVTPATQSEIMLDRAYTAPLAATASVNYAVAPKKVKADTFGGLFMLTIEQAGTYAIGIDQAAWIDVIRDNRTVRSAGDGDGPACSTIRKVVDFRLEPGHYTVQISNATKDKAVVAVVAK